MYLAGHERAIVTDIRRNNERCIRRDRSSIRRTQLPMLVDTARIRQTEDLIEKIGVDKALEYAETADLIIYVDRCIREVWMKMMRRSLI